MIWRNGQLKKNSAHCPDLTGRLGKISANCPELTGELSGIDRVNWYRSRWGVRNWPMLFIQTSSNRGTPHVTLNNSTWNLNCSLFKRLQTLLELDTWRWVIRRGNPIAWVTVSFEHDRLSKHCSSMFKRLLSLFMLSSFCEERDSRNLRCARARISCDFILWDGKARDSRNRRCASARNSWTNSHQNVFKKWTWLKFAN